MPSTKGGLMSSLDEAPTARATVSTVRTFAAPILGARMAQATGGGSRLDRLLKLLECACAILS
jgi:hypothetical protein